MYKIQNRGDKPQALTNDSPMWVTWSYYQGQNSLKGNQAETCMLPVTGISEIYGWFSLLQRHKIAAIMKYYIASPILPPLL